MSDVEVKLGADAGDLKSGMDDAAASIAQSLQDISSALKGFAGKNKEATEAAIKNNADLSRSFIELRGSMVQGFDAIGGVVERFRGIMAGLAGVLAGGALGKESVEAMLSLEASVRGLEIAFGMTAEKATLTATALSLAGISAETYEQMGMKVGRQLKANGEEFDRLGVVTKDAAHNLLPMDEILNNVYKRMQDFKAGTDQTEFALSTVGRSAKDFASDMQRLNSVTARAKQMQAELGIEMGPARQTQIEAYRVEFNAFKLIMEEMGVRIGEQLLPNLMKMASWFTGEGKSAIATAVNIFKTLGTGIAVVWGILDGLGTFIGTWIAAVVRAFDLFGDAIRAVAHGDWDGIKMAAAKSLQNVAQLYVDTGKNITDSVNKTVAKVTALWASAEGGGASQGGERPTPGSGSEHFKAKPKDGGGKLAAMTAELEQMKEASSNYLASTTAMELDFWQKQLAAVEGNGAKEVKLREEIGHKIYAANKASATQVQAAYMAEGEYEISLLKTDGAAKVAKVKEISDEVTRVYGAGTTQSIEWLHKVSDAERAAAEASKEIAAKKLQDLAAHNERLLDEQLSAAQSQKNLGMITETQLLAIDIDIATKRLRIQQDLATQLEILWAGNEKKLEEVQKALEKALDASAKTIQKDQQQAAQQTYNAWKSSMSQITSAFESAVMGMINRTMTFKQAMAKIFGSIVQTFIDFEIKRMTTSWAQGFAKMAGDSNTFASIQKAIDSMLGISATTTATTTATAQKTSAAEVIPAEAAVAAGGAASAVADIPYVGPALAAAAYAETFAMVMAGMSVAGFAGGAWDIPRTGLAVLHPHESVLPAAAAAGFRNMAQGGGGGNTINVHNTSMDSQSVEQALMKGGALHKALTRLQRSGALS